METTMEARLCVRTCDAALAEVEGGGRTRAEVTEMQKDRGAALFGSVDVLLKQC